MCTYASLHVYRGCFFCVHMRVHRSVDICPSVYVCPRVPLGLCTRMCMHPSVRMNCVCAGSQPRSPPANAPRLSPPGSQPIFLIPLNSEPAFPLPISTSFLLLGTCSEPLSHCIGTWRGGVCAQGAGSVCLCVCIYCISVSPLWTSSPSTWPYVVGSLA